MLDTALLTDPAIWVAFATLTLLEIVLGIDNVVFISILADKLPEEQRQKARRVGLALAMIIRILLLLSITWVMGLTAPIIEDALGLALSGALTPAGGSRNCVFSEYASSKYEKQRSGRAWLITMSRIRCSSHLTCARHKSRQAMPAAMAAAISHMYFRRPDE